jgi:hypothetical protein
MATLGSWVLGTSTLGDSGGATQHPVSGTVEAVSAASGAATVIAGGPQTLYATSHLAGTCPSPANAVGAPDGTWAGPTAANTPWTSRWAMGDPSGPLTGTQTIAVRVRKTSQSTNPSVQVNLYENGTLVTSLIATTAVSSTTGVDLSGIFNASAITNPANIEVEVVATVGGGTTSTRASLQLDAITFTATVGSGGATQYPASGTVAATSTTTAAVAARLAASGAVGATSTAAGAVASLLAVAGSVDAVSAAAGTADVQGGSQAYPVSGTVAATSGTSGTVGARLAASGTAPATTGVSLTVGALRLVTGTIAATSSVTGAADRIDGGALSAHGTVSATTTVQATTGLKAAVAGTVAAVSTLTGAVTSVRPVSGTAGALTSVTGDVTALLPVAGVVSAVTDVSGSAFNPNQQRDVTLELPAPQGHPLRIGPPRTRARIGSPTGHPATITAPRSQP